MRSILMTAFAIGLCTAAAVWPQHGSAQTLTAILGDEHGAYVAGPDGRPVYAFLSSEEMGGDGLDPLESCNVKMCRQEWPPVTVEGEVTVGEGLDPDLAETRRVDGEAILFYSDHPLFQFYKDVPGEPPNGQGIYDYGGYWALLTPVGGTIRTGPMREVDELPVSPQD